MENNSKKILIKSWKMLKFRNQKPQIPMKLYLKIQRKNIWEFKKS